MEFLGYLVLIIGTAAFIYLRTKIAHAVFGTNDKIAFIWQKVSDTLNTMGIVAFWLMISFLINGEMNIENSYLLLFPLLFIVLTSGSYILFYPDHVIKSDFYTKKTFSIKDLSTAEVGLERGRYSYHIKLKVSTYDGTILKIGSLYALKDEEVNEIINTLQAKNIKINFPSRPSENIYKYISKSAKSILDPIWQKNV